MKKKFSSLVALSLAAITMASCGGSSVWSFDECVKDDTLDYALLIGQLDHNDSAARTGGIREALNTRPAATTNANTEKPVKGSIKIGSKTYEVNEIVQGEQKNTSGTTWDATTATTSIETWLNTYKGKIDFVVSNNDGMAVGALGATNWVKGTPLFGYDSNQDALQYIIDGDMSGTINQNAPAQTAAIYMAVRNALDGATAAQMTTWGFTEENPNGYGKLTSAVSYDEESHAILANNVAVTKENASKFQTSDMATLAEATIKQGTTAKKKVWHSYYSNTDTFLTSSMEPLFNAYKSKFNLDVTQKKSTNSADDTDQLAALDAAEGFDAYVVNMVKTTSTKEYLDKIATKVGATAENPTSVPVIFWNRQGTKEDGTTDTANMQDSRFKYVYYVGFDAIQGGKLQGQMILDYFAQFAK